MTDYKAIQCKKCMWFCMSTAKKPKCIRCGSSVTEVMLTRTDSRIITEYIKEKNLKLGLQ